MTFNSRVYVVGDITMGEILSVQPFGNTMDLVELKVGGMGRYRHLISSPTVLLLKLDTCFVSYRSNSTSL